MPTCVCGEVVELKRDTTPLDFPSKSVTTKQIENELLVKGKLQKMESCISFPKASHPLFILHTTVLYEVFPYQRDQFFTPFPTVNSIILSNPTIALRSLH